jgi:hypothetical protein
MNIRCSVFAEIKILQRWRSLFESRDEHIFPKLATSIVMNTCRSVFRWSSRHAGDRKKRQSSQKSGVKYKFEKGNVYSTVRLTCGTYLAAAASTFIIQRGWHVGPTNQHRSRRFSKGAGDRKKKASSSKSGVQKIQERKGLSHKEADILYPVCSSVINVSKAVEFERKRQIAIN